ncbi:MAG: 4-alpha-glucanotransferase [Bryobacteraceae bacterium]
MTSRASGILLHPTSLPGRYGIGDLGPEAHRFADWLAAAGQRIWQVLPLGPVGYGESPYQLFSAFAGNPLLISPDLLAERGWLEPADLTGAPSFSEVSVDFERVIHWKTILLHKAFDRFRTHSLPADHEAFSTFVHRHTAWLPAFARFMALKEANGGRMWTEWDKSIQPNPTEMKYHQFVQFQFFEQWCALKAYCANLGIRMMGDLPIYVAGDSADVWERPELFDTTAVSGVPPDYFSATGQLWGNPLYRWDEMKEAGYRWWIERMRAALAMFDLVRIDHFRGFEAYWAVPAGEPTAEHGQWIKGPGADLFHALEAGLGKLPVVAENLGVITPEVEALRNEFGFPGMAILQFAFGKDDQARSFKPHNYVHNLVAYSGTHDNDTVMGWWQSEGGDSTRSAEDIAEEKTHARQYLATDGAAMNWMLIRALMASVADTVLFPAQDILGLGSEARMNTPAVASGNWRWRMKPGALTPELASRLHEMSLVYERLG